VRSTINSYIGRIVAMFRWATQLELITEDIHHRLKTVASLRAGRTDAKESVPVQPIADEIVEATLPHLSSVIRAMVQLQRLTGARPGEICSMKIGDIDRTNKDVWSYRPTEHKTQHHGHQRVIYIGSKAQDIIRPFLLKLDATAHVFSPVESVTEMRQHRAESRKTPLSTGNKPRSNVKRRPSRVPSNHYDVNAYRRAIARACDAADQWAKAGSVIPNDERMIPRWHPHQLRHTAATDIRRQFGLEAAQHVLGHSTTAMTEVYAERNQDIARAVAAKIG
jgi:integrase